MAIILALDVPLGSALSAWADCKSDCRDQYESNTESCKSTYEDPEDSEYLQKCIDSAQDQYDSCLGECEDENETV